MGGVAAASYASAHQGKPGDDHGIAGIIFLASYPTESLDIPALLIYGSEDQVLDREAFEDGIANLNAARKQTVIDGGNHAQFGNYGPQRGDGTATISAEEQQRITIETILQWLP